MGDVVNDIVSVPSKPRGGISVQPVIHIRTSANVGMTPNPEGRVPVVRKQRTHT